MTSPPRRLVASCLVAAVVLAFTPGLESGSYIFAGLANGLNLITHPQGYITGTETTLTVTVGIETGTPNAAAMLTSVQNIVNTVNGLSPTTGNLVFGASNNVGPTEVDFESVALHEVGHSLGLAHVNLASESGLSGDDRNYTKSTDGVDGGYNLNRGVDMVRGSSDDIRGDDDNLHWFRMVNNNPFTIAGTVDATSYSRDVMMLPMGHTFPANADRSVSTLLGVPDTESVMQQGTFLDEVQRTLTHDDVATLRLAMSGVDETANTADDYTLTLSFLGIVPAADILLDFDNSTGFAVSISNGNFISGSSTHAYITTTAVHFNTGFNWFFNDVSNAGSDLSITKADDVDPIIAGNTLSYTVTVTNAGPSQADNVVVTDTLPAGVTFVSSSGCAEDPGGEPTCSLASIASGASTPYTITVMVDVGTTGTITNVASVTSATADPNNADNSAATTDPDPSNNSASENTTVNPPSGGPFIDAPLDGKVVKALNVTELQQRINAVRIGKCGLGNFPFTAVSMGDQILASHILQLRMAVNQAEMAPACNIATTIFTDPNLGPGTPTTIKAAHFHELHGATIALEVLP